MNEKRLRLELESIYENDLALTDSETENTFIKILKDELSTLRIFLYQELINSKDKSRFVGFEVTNKKLKSIKYFFRGNKKIPQILETLNQLLRWLLQICNAEENTTIDGIRARDLKLFGITLTKESYDIIDFKKSIMKSIWMISYYLSPHWPTEKELMGDSIDLDFSRRLGLEKRLVVKEEKPLPDYFEDIGKLEKTSIQKRKEYRTIIEDIINNLDHQHFVKEIKVKSVVQEALNKKIMQGETIEILWTLDKEKKIVMLDDEHLMVKNLL